MVWVHGHGQCAVCHTNVDECCRGESGEPEGVRDNRMPASNPGARPQNADDPQDRRTDRSRRDHDAHQGGTDADGKP